MFLPFGLLFWEKQKKEGHLWIDRNSKTFIVTLGALNGIEVGTRLALYDGAERIGSLHVARVMDVISYVEPVGSKTLNDFASNYYKVVFEK